VSGVAENDDFRLFRSMYFPKCHMQDHNDWNELTEYFPKLESSGSPLVKNHTFVHFDTIPSDRRTDGRTDRQTDISSLAIPALAWYSAGKTGNRCLCYRAVTSSSLQSSHLLFY